MREVSSSGEDGAMSDEGGAMSEEALAKRLGFDSDVIAQVRATAGGDTLAVIERDAYAEEHDEDVKDGEAAEAGETPDAGLTVAVAREGSPEVLRRLREALVPRGYLPFRIDESYAEENPTDSIAVLKTGDKFAPVRFCRTNGINYDVDTDAVLAKLADWDRRLGVTVLGAEFDSLYVTFDRLPQDLAAFAEELYESCPDLLDQGLEVMVDEAFEYLSEEQQELVQARLDEDEGDEDGTAHRVALRMLADEVARHRSVSFWWD